MCFVSTGHNAGCRYCLGMPEKRPNEKASAIVYTVSGNVKESPAETGNPHLVCGVK